MPSGAESEWDVFCMPVRRSFSICPGELLKLVKQSNPGAVLAFPSHGSFGLTAGHLGSGAATNDRSSEAGQAQGRAVCSHTTSSQCGRDGAPQRVRQCQAVFSSCVRMPSAHAMMLRVAHHVREQAAKLWAESQRLQKMLQAISSTLVSVFTV